MKIFTYYQNINFDSQTPILKLWKKSWEKQGFDATVLTVKDARQSPYYYGFLKKIRLIHKNITGYDISQYGISCYVRWLAYSALKRTEPFLVSDYDVINKGFTAEDIKESEEKINFQLEIFAKALDMAILKGQNSLIIIHGVGKGVLKNKIHELLNQTKQVHSYVNQFDNRYGFGATEIFFGY